MSLFEVETLSSESESPLDIRLMKRALFISNLFPSIAEPIRGLDNAALLHAMSKKWEFRVLSPRAALAPFGFRSPKCRREDLLFDPAYIPAPYMPKFGSRWNDHLMKIWLSRSFERILDEFHPEVILCSWLFPDGCAVTQLAERHKIPVVLVTQGTDTHTYLENLLRRDKILKAVANSSGVICRSKDLSYRLEKAGADSNSLHVIYNGVDTNVFRKRERAKARESLGVEHVDPILLFVGNYLPVKNPLFLISMLRELNRRRNLSGDQPARLVFIGDGSLRVAMERETLKKELCDHVTILPRKSAEEISIWMAAADVFCLSSYNEGFPNVLLEAMACELPIVSTDVGGISELIDCPARGALVPIGDLTAYVDTVIEVLGNHDIVGSQKSSIRDMSWVAAAASYAKVMDAAVEKRVQGRASQSGNRM